MNNAKSMSGGILRCSSVDSRAGSPHPARTPATQRIASNALPADPIHRHADLTPSPFSVQKFSEVNSTLIADVFGCGHASPPLAAWLKLAMDPTIHFAVGYADGWARWLL